MITRRFFLQVASAVGAGALLGLTGCSGEKPSDGSNNQNKVPTGADAGTYANTTTAVICFSATGNTWSVAEKIAAKVQCRAIRLEAVQPYTAEDLDYHAATARARTEQDSKTARPQIAGSLPDVSGYSTIYLGYPIWWGMAPRIIMTFLEGVDLSGKTVIPFCTSGGSDIVGSIPEIKSFSPGATVYDGKRFTADATADDVAAWIS